MTTARRISIAALALLTAGVLSGCSMETLQNETSDEFETVADLTTAWELPVAWLPENSVDIRTHSAINGDLAIVRATTDESLDPASCAEVERQSGPVYEEDWSPNAYVETAWACGDWTVIPTDDGWYGWTPNHPDERAAAPAAD